MREVAQNIVIPKRRMRPDTELSPLLHAEMLTTQ
jgi:hypothetical protein